jgi:hypothetical protein
MQSWSILTESLSNSSNVSTLITGLTGVVGAEPIELLNWTSVSTLDKILDRKDTFFWYAGFNYDVKSSF